MKKLFFIEDTLTNKISYWHLASFLFVLPFDFFYSEIILVSYAIHTLIHLQKRNLKNIFTKPVFLVSSMYLLGLLAISYSPDKKEAINVATRQLAILLIPILFALNELNLCRYKESLFSIFGYTCTVTVIYLFADAFHTIYYFHLPLSSLYNMAFMNHNFSLPLDFHATYLSVYVAFSICIFMYLFFNKPTGKIKYVYLFCILILLMGMLQLSSRATFIALLFVVNLAFPFLLFKGRKRLLFFAGVSLFSSIVLFSISNIDSFKLRYVSDLRKDLADNVINVENMEPRMARWEATLELVNASPLIGYGSGSEKELLKKKYFEKKFYNSYIREYNAHNEYLSILLKTGMIGLALYLYVLCSGLWMAWCRRDVIFSGFMLIILVVSISENVLDLNKGIFFYAFFFSFFLLEDKRTAVIEPAI